MNARKWLALLLLALPVVPAAADTQHSLVEAADYALRRAKRGGGNCVFAVFGDIANREN